MTAPILLKLNKYWRDEAYGHATIERGEKYFKSGRVRLTHVISENDVLKIKSRVSSSGGSEIYNVGVSLDKQGMPTEYYCDCPAIDKYPGMCKHCVATLLSYDDYYKAKTGGEDYEAPDLIPQYSAGGKRGKNGGKTPRDSRSEIEKRMADNLLSSYKSFAENEALLSASSAQGERFVTLVPILNVKQFNGGAEISFQIRKRSREEIEGNAEEPYESDDVVFVSSQPRPYIIKSIKGFLNGVEKREHLKFGKELEFNACMEAFDETSQRWIAFLSKHCALTQSDNGRYGRSYYGDRTLPITKSALDEVFDSFRECLFRIGESGLMYRRVMSDEAPSAEIYLEEEANGFIFLRCDRAIDAYISSPQDEHAYYERLRGGTDAVPASFGGYVYVIENGWIKRFSAQASRALAPLFRALIDTGGKMRFSAEQKNDLSEHLLSEISRYIKVNLSPSMKSEMRVEHMTGWIILDSPDRESVTAAMLAGYGGILLDMDVGRAVGRETAREDDAGGNTSNAGINWDVAGIDSSRIRRDYHAERRFAVRTGQILGLSREEIIARLPPDGGSAASSGRLSLPVTVSGSDAVYELLTGGIDELRKSGEVLVTDKLRRLSVEPPKRINVGVALDCGLLKFNIADNNVPLDEMRDMLRAYHEKKRYFRLKSGSFISFDKVGDDVIKGMDEFNEARQGLQIDDDELAKGEAELPAFRAMYLDGLFNEYSGLNASRDRAFDELTARVKNFAAAEYEAPDSLKGVLRDYQKVGYRWMRTLESCSFCGILADDMGLGKSVQLISVMLNKYQGSAGRDVLPSMIACPSSLALNWQKEFEKFAPSLRTRVIQGSLAARDALIEDIRPGEIVITSYDLLKRDIDKYKGVSFHYFAIDEAQYVKNHTTQAAKAVKKIVCAERFALTGTPVENRLSELWSIFDFLMPGYLFRYARFKKEFEVPIARDSDEIAKANLRRMIMPFMLRRLKADVLSELPPKTTAVVPVSMNDEQMRAYNAMLLTGVEALKADENRPEGVAKMQVLALLTKLRRLCCDPRLCFDSLNCESSKLEACMELLNQARDGGHRVLLFSQYTDMLDIIESRIKSEEMSFLRLQGSTPVKERLNLVDEFNRGNTDVFLISLKAGGTGLNLTAADTVIHYDPWWNLAAQDQATDRAHRIGQRKSVQVYKLIAQDTIEEKILKLQQMKKDLASIVETDDGEGGLMNLTAEELAEILKDR